MKFSATFVSLVLAVGLVEASVLHVQRDSTDARRSTAAASSALMNVTSSQCGSSGATAAVTATSGPNGSEDWLNCGVNAGGWTPPPVTIADVKVQTLSAALATVESAFANCQKYISMFEEYGAQVGVPSIFLASIAMQGSSCIPTVTGANGGQGLMQLTTDKCTGAPGGNCMDPDFNIRTGANYLQSLLAANGGNVLLAIGQYNNWQPGMTVRSATLGASHGCCSCQNNLDYLMQFMNGWVQGINPVTNAARLGKYFNTANC